MFFDRSATTKVRARQGWIYAEPLNNGARYRVTASGQRAEVVNRAEVKDVVSELLRAMGGAVMGIARTESAQTVVKRLLEAIPPEDEPEQNLDRITQHIVQSDERKAQREFEVKLREAKRRFKDRLASGNINSPAQADEAAGDTAIDAGYEVGSDEEEHILAVLFRMAAKAFPGDY